MRPTYQSEEDLSREDKVAATLAWFWDLEIGSNLGDYERIDRIAYDKDRIAVAWVEIKVRNNRSLAYPDYMISRHKVDYAKWLRRVTHMPVILAVSFTDSLKWLHLHDVPYEVRKGGRVDRGDAMDRELCAFIDMELFQTVCEF